MVRNVEQPGWMPLPHASVSGSPSESKAKWNMRVELELELELELDPDPDLAHLDTAPQREWLRNGDEDVATPAMDLERGGDVLIAVGRLWERATRTSPPRSLGGQNGTASASPREPKPRVVPEWGGL